MEQVSFSEILPLPERDPGFRPSFNVLVHLENIGDSMFHASEWAGTKGQSRRLEGFQLDFVPKMPNLKFEYMGHLQDLGDTEWTSDGTFCGTRGQSRRLEGFAVRLKGPLAEWYDVYYQAHLQDLGDTGTFQNGQFCGTRGQSRRLEAIHVWVVAKL